MIDESFDYTGYLAAKKHIDDNSLNKQVWSTMCHWLQKRQKTKRTLKIVEIGAGVGTMIERLLEHNMISNCVYTAVEQEPGFRDHALQYLQSCSSSLTVSIQEKEDYWTIKNKHCNFTVNWVIGDAMDIERYGSQNEYDLLISHAVIDLLPVPVFLPRLFKRLAPETGYYLSLNFSGKTEFYPAEQDDKIIYQAYHQDMDNRFTGIDWQASQTGKLLGSWLIDNGHSVIAAGPSAWDLSANEGGISSDFIANILDTIEKALKGMPELENWLLVRRKQLSFGQLRFIASNTDYFGIVQPEEYC